MSDVEVIDNFLPQEQFLKLQDQIQDHRFPWFVGNSIVNQTTEEKYLYGLIDENFNWQLHHMFYFSPNRISEAMPVVSPVFEALDVGILVKAKINLNPATNEIVCHGFHRDQEPEKLAELMTTAVYYINSNDGYTEFDDGTTVNSVANRLVRFPCNTLHRGTSCTNNKYRLVLNINYIPRVL